MGVFAVRLCIKTIIAKHIKTLFRNVDNQTLDEIMGRNRFPNTSEPLHNGKISNLIKGIKRVWIFL